MAIGSIGPQGFRVWNFLRRVIWFGLILTVLFFGIWGFENWRGGSEWRRAKERAARMQVSLDLGDDPGKAVPEGGSLMEDGIFLAEWEGQIDPPLARVADMELEGVKTRGINSGSLARGKSFRYSQYFEEGVGEKKAVRRLGKIYQPIAERLERLGKVVLKKPQQDLWSESDGLIDFGTIFRLKGMTNAFGEFARISLRRGDSEKAGWACEVLARLRENSCEPALINLLISHSIDRVRDEIIWEGIRLHRWDRGDLDRLAALVQAGPDYEGLEKALRYEAAITESFVEGAEERNVELLEDPGVSWKDLDLETLDERLRNWTSFQGPAGWQNWRKATMLNGVLYLLEGREGWDRPGEGRVVTGDLNAFEKSRFHPLLWVRGIRGSGVDSLVSVQRQATRGRLARIAIELERYRLKKRRYPASLDEMNFTFSTQDLTDPEGRDLRYERTAAGFFRIWSEFEREGVRRPMLQWAFPETGGK